MKDRLFAIGRPATIALACLCAGSADADIMPHRALYTMSLERTGGDASVTGASGTMAYQWGETCGGWTVEQRYRLRMAYADSPDVAIASNFVTWEAKDGLSYRFNQKETRNGSGARPGSTAPAKAAPPNSRDPRRRPSSCRPACCFPAPTRSF
jgi:hypothetical protein